MRSDSRVIQLQVEVEATWRGEGSVLLVGEAPGEEEVKKGEGFVGASGWLLNSMLGAAGLSRDEVSLCNVVRRRPANNDFSVFYETVKVGGKKVVRATEELQEWRALLWDDIVRQKPGVVVAIGQEALKALTGLEGISHRRGSVYKLPSGQWCVAMLHPAAILRAGAWQEVVIGAECCLKRAQEVMRPGWEPWRYEVEVVTEDEMIAHLWEVERRGRLWALDLETIPGDGVKVGSVSVLSIAYRAEGEVRAAVLPWPRGVVWDEVGKVLKRGKVCGHNFNYDRAWLRQVGAWPDGASVEMDTMQVWKRRMAELPKALDFCSMWAFGQHLAYWKDEGRRLHGKRKKTSEEQIAYWMYGAKDAVATLWLAEWLEKRGGMTALDKEMWQWAAEMADRGMGLDVGAVRRLSAEVRERKARALDDIAYLHPALNPKSSQQVGKLLYEELGLPEQTKGKRRTADEDALKALQRIKPTAIVGKLLTWRKLEKLISGFLDVLETASRRADQTLYCGWTAAATETWRYASSNHPLGGGLNAQTVPSCLRYLVTAPPGRVFLQPDLSQAEARYVAARARCKPLLALFSDPSKSIHLERAKQIYGRDIAKDSYEYTAAKRVVHGTNYMMGARRLAQQIGVKEGEAKVLLAKARAPYPEIERWHEEVRGIAKKVGKLMNCFGMERVCIAALGGVIATGRVPDQEWKELVAWEPQSAIPHVTYLAMQQLASLRTGDELWFHAHGHDSFLASVPEEAVEQWGREIREELTFPLVVQGIEIIIPTDVQVGKTWGQMVPLKDGWRETVEALPSPEQVDVDGVIERALASILDSIGEEGE